MSALHGSCRGTCCWWLGHLISGGFWAYLVLNTAPPPECFILIDKLPVAGPQCVDLRLFLALWVHAITSLVYLQPKLRKEAFKQDVHLLATPPHLLLSVLCSMIPEVRQAPLCYMVSNVTLRACVLSNGLRICRVLASSP